MIRMADKSQLEQRLEELSKEYSGTKYNKATNKHLGILRKKISEIKSEIVEASKGRKGSGFSVKKRGDATVALMGFPSAGKSSLINALTNTKSKTAQYEFTTTTVVPGMMFYNDAHIQIFDMPGIIENAHLGSGGGKAVISSMKVADLIVFVLDIERLANLRILLNELRALNVQVNRRRPRVSIHEEEHSTGILVESNRSKISEPEIQTILSGFGVHNARIRIEESIEIADLVNVASGNAYYMRAIVALNKIDMASGYRKIAEELSKQYGITVVPVSATNASNIDDLKAAIYKNLDIITVYLKPKEERTAKPLILRSGSTIGDAAAKIHTEILDNLKCAYITGPSAKFRNQRVGISHVLKGNDIITFIKQ